MKKKYFLKDYKKYGYSLIRNVLTKNQIKTIQEAIIDRVNLDFDKNFTLNEFNKKNFHNFVLKKRKEDPEKFSNFYNTLQTNINIFTITSAKKLKKYVKEMLEIKKDFLSCSDFLLRIDAPLDKRNSLDWHQDSSYFKRTNDMNDCCVIWIPLQKIDKKIGPLNLIPFSHLLGGLPFDRKQKNLLASPQNRINKKYYKNKKIDKFNMSIGDVLLMDSKVIHRSGKNFSKMLRFTILTRMVSTLNKTFIPGRLIYQNKDDYNKNLLKRG